jgi:hypothetical protein
MSHTIPCSPFAECQIFQIEKILLHLKDMRRRTLAQAFFETFGKWEAFRNSVWLNG